LSTLIDDHIGFIAQAASFLLAGTRIPSIYASLFRRGEWPAGLPSLKRAVGIPGKHSQHAFAAALPR
jgi:hypothetical protein